MKKLVGLTALAAVLVLSACGGSSDEIVCTGEEDLFDIGMPVEMTVTLQTDGDYVTAYEFEMSIDTSDMESDEAEAIAELFDSTVDGDTIVISETEELEEEELSVEAFIDELETDGLTCT